MPVRATPMDSIFGPLNINLGLPSQLNEGTLDLSVLHQFQTYEIACRCSDRTIDLGQCERLLIDTHIIHNHRTFHKVRIYVSLNGNVENDIVWIIKRPGLSIFYFWLVGVVHDAID